MRSSLPVVDVATAGATTRARMIALVPAHNEEEQIGAAVDSLLAQTRPLDRIVVVADNCTDATAAIARAKGVDVIETVGNTARKAGALNCGFREAEARSYEYVLQMDADTVLGETFVEDALERLEADPDVGGLCARYRVKDARGILHRLQKLEYHRFVRVQEKKGISVLSGTAVALRVEALPSPVWDETSLVEDYRLTLDLKRNGWKVASGPTAYTDTMKTVRAFWRQRVRWARGTIEELSREGWQPYTRRDILLHVAFAAGVLVRCLWFVALALTLALVGLAWNPWWLIPTAIILAERVLSVRDLERRDVLVAATMIPEELCQIIREGVLVWSACLALYRRAGRAW